CRRKISVRSGLGHHLAQECALLGKDEFLLLGEAEIGHAFVVVPKPRAIALVGRKALEGNQCESDVVGAFMRLEIADQVAAASGNDREPALGILLELRASERIKLIADKHGDSHGNLYSRRRCRPAIYRLPRMNASVIIEA